MSRSAAATAAGRQRALPRQPGPPRHRRISGPARPQDRPPRARIDASVLAAPGAVAYPRLQRLPARAPLSVVAGGAAIATRVAGVALEVSSSRLMDRLVRSRMWIGVVAFALIGIVAMQVSMLKLNAGIGRAVETINTLERTNASARAEVSRLSSGDRIQSLAGVRGFVMPAPADVTYLHAGATRSLAALAARRMIAPDRALAGPAGAPLPSTATPPGASAIATPPGPTAPVQAATTAPATTPATTATATAPPVPTATAPASTAAPAAAPAAPPPPAQVAAPTAATAPQTGASPAGGVAPPTAAPAVGGTG